MIFLNGMSKYLTSYITVSSIAGLFYGSQRIEWQTTDKVGRIYKKKNILLSVSSGMIGLSLGPLCLPLVTTAEIFGYKVHSTIYYTSKYERFHLSNITM